MPFVANTDDQRREMLAEIGLSMDDLFAAIPRNHRCSGLNLPKGLSEQAVRSRLADIAAKNHIDLTLFLGGGFYDHFIPAAVGALASRGEFYTAYTPYQPEVSQGTLQAIYEYQSMICRLTGLDVANASLYDGGTAIYEAMTMAMNATRRDKVIVDDSVNPIYRVMLESYTRNLHIELVTTANSGGHVNREAILAALDDRTAAVIVQNPNFFGCIEEFSDLAEAAHAVGALLVVSCYPISLGILKTPGEMGADIAVGEGQADLITLQRFLVEYEQTGQRGVFTDFLVEKNLITPHEAVQLARRASEFASERARRLTEAKSQLDALAKRESLTPADPNDRPSDSHRGRRVEKPHDPQSLAATRKGQPVPPQPGKKSSSPSESDIIVFDDSDPNALAGDDTAILRPATPVPAGLNAAARQPQPAERTQIYTQEQIEHLQDEPFRQPAPAAGPVPPGRLPFFVLGFAAGILVCSGLYLVRSAVARILGGGEAPASVEKAVDR
mgnify:CR=1 FL=1